MSTTICCSIPGASQTKDPVRLVDANGILRSVDMSGCAYNGSEYSTPLAYPLAGKQCNSVEKILAWSIHTEVKTDAKSQNYSLHRKRTRIMHRM